MKELGKIIEVNFGNGGYQDCMKGYSFVLGGKSWTVSDFWGAPGKGSEVREEVRKEILGEKSLKVLNLMEEAKVRSLESLKGIPIEAEFDSNLRLKNWRVLTEVL